MNPSDLEALGAPDLQIVGLRVWVHGRHFPEATYYWDGNWLLVTACCVYPHAMVRTHGSIIHLGELVGLLEDCSRMYETLAGEAKLACIEPNLGVQFKMQWNGSISVHLEITHNQLTERHSFDDEIDQTQLPAIMGQCHSILASYPLREPHVRRSVNDV